MTEKRIRVRLDSGNTKAEIKSINGEMTGLGSSADKTTDSMRKLTSIAQAVASALAAAQIVKYADSWTTVNNRLAQATSSSSEFVKAQKGVIAIAQETSSEIEGVATFYARLAQATSELEISQERLLDVTNKTILALKVGGATAQEASSVAIQLSQALGAGALQGDELRAILDASIPITKALAKEFGVSTGQLKTLGAQGLLTSEKVISAIENMDESALTFTKTFADGLTNVNNSLTVYVGEINESLGATKTAGEALNSLADNIEVVGKGLIVVATIFGARLTGAIASSTNAYIANLAAIRANSVANTELLAKNVALAKSELAKNIQIQAGAQRYLANAKGAYALGAATTALAKANGTVAASQATLITSTNALTAAQARGTIVTRGATAAMGLLGGPVGIAVIAASAIAYFATTMDTASTAADNYAERVKAVTGELKENEKQQGKANEALRDSLKINISSKIKALETDLKKQEQAILDATRSGADFSAGLTTATQKAGELEAQINSLKQSLFELNSETSKEDILKGVDVGAQTGGQANVGSGIDSNDAVNASLDAFFAEEDKLQFDALGNAIEYNQKKFELLQRSLSLETQAIQEEAEVRAAFAAGEINQRQLNEELALQNIFFSYEERRAAILENEQLTFDQRNELLSGLKEQELEAERLKQSELTSITKEGSEERNLIAEQEAAQTRGLLISTGVAALSLMNSSNEEMTKQQKSQAKKSIYIQTAAAIARAYGENNFYVASGMAVFLAGMQLKQLSAVKTAGPSSSAGSSSPATAPSSVSSTLASSSTINQSTQRVFNIELPESGFVAVDTVGDILKSLAENNEDMQIAISKGQSQAKRVGAI